MDSICKQSKSLGSEMRIYHNIWLKDVGERSSRDCLATLKSVVFFYLKGNETL